MLSLSEYIYFYFILLLTRRAISDSNKPKKCSSSRNKNNLPTITYLTCLSFCLWTVFEGCRRRARRPATACTRTRSWSRATRATCAPAGSTWTRAAALPSSSRRRGLAARSRRQPATSCSGTGVCSSSRTRRRSTRLSTLTRSWWPLAADMPEVRLPGRGSHFFSSFLLFFCCCCWEWCCCGLWVEPARSKAEDGAIFVGRTWN